MARLLTIPSECRLRIYDWYLQGISARLSVNSREMDGLPDKQSQYSVSFDFQEDKPAVIVNQHLDLLGVQKIKTCTCIGLYMIPLDIFPGTKQLIVKECRPEIIGGVEKQVEWFNNITQDAGVMERVSNRAIELHACYKEKFGLSKVSPTCTLDLTLEFGSFGASVTAVENGVRKIVRTFHGPVLDVHVKGTLCGNPSVDTQLSKPWIEAQSHKAVDLVWRDPQQRYDEDHDEDDEDIEEDEEDEEEGHNDEVREESESEEEVGDGAECQLHEYLPDPVVKTSDSSWKMGEAW